MIVIVIIIVIVIEIVIAIVNVIAIVIETAIVIVIVTAIVIVNASTNFKTLNFLRSVKKITRHWTLYVVTFYFNAGW